jgi:hypothetical protein
MPLSDAQHERFATAAGLQRDRTREAAVNAALVGVSLMMLAGACHVSQAMGVMVISFGAPVMPAASRMV